LVGKPEGKRPLEDPGLDGRIILRWVFRKWDVGAWTGSSWLRIRTDDEYCECVNEAVNFLTNRNRLSSQEGICSME